MEYKGLGLGCMQMNTANAAENISVIQEAINEGVTFINTGDFYGSGESEMVVGHALKSYRRDDYYISVKFGALISPSGGIYGLDVHPFRIKNYLIHSLKRLNLEYIDLYQPCRIDEAIPVEEIIGALAELVKEGYIRHIGLSQIDAETLKRANAVHKIEAVEMDYSLFNREIEQDMIPTARKLGIGVAAFGILAHGFMSGKYTKDRFKQEEVESIPRIPLLFEENIEKNLEVLEELQEIAREKCITLPQLAHAWVISKGEDIIPIIGASKMKNFTDSVKARHVVLSEEDRSKIETAVLKVSGASFPNYVFRDGAIAQS